ncbi:MAG: hypothetical protein ACREMW_13915 [Gemmatimonadales bacterium]
MEIIAPVIGVGSIILIGAVGIVMVRVLTSKFAHPQLKGDQSERDHLLEEVQVRLGELDQLKQQVSELEERVDFAERLLARQREGQRLGPPQD